MTTETQDPTPALAAATPALSPLDRAFERINASPADPIIKAKVYALMVGYDRVWTPNTWRSISVEGEYCNSIINPETQAPSRTYAFAGKRDGVIQSAGGHLHLLEHKTTSDDISDPNADYWQRLAIDSQVSSYVLNCWQEGQKIDGTLYDVVKKPGIRPKKIPMGDLANKSKKRTDAENFGTMSELVSHGTYFGIPTPTPQGEDETPDLYYARLVHDVTTRPEHYYARKTVPRLDGDLLEFANELWDLSVEIRETRTRERNYRNSDACCTYGRTCPYLPLCAGQDTTASDNWQARKSIHPELSQITGDGRNVLTVSRIKCFQLCRRKHYYLYELGIERRRLGGEDVENLILGHLWHEAQEAWWSAFAVPTSI